jgi:hypothetical protein
MGVIKKIKRAVRGEVKLTTAAREVLRRGRASVQARGERSSLKKPQEHAQLKPEFASRSSAELLTHFQTRKVPHSLPGFTTTSPESLAAAQRIVSDHSWPLLGFGEHSFGAAIEWRRDPLSGYLWPLDFHRDIQLIRSDGSDARVLWEVNRLGHLITLGRAYATTKDELFTTEFVAQVKSWTEQNPVGFGPNWTCAMEVALRAINVLVAFELFCRSPSLDGEFLKLVLRFFDQHGSYIRRNLEFSYLATSNHYLSDVVGLLWLGILLPELSQATEWRNFGLREMLREMDKQILDDGADFESSTAYHRFILELLLYSFLLCRANEIEIEARYWARLHRMLEYLRTYLRPDGFAPLIGDSDSGQVLPIHQRRGDDHSYLLAPGAVLFSDPRLKLQSEPPAELFWLLGEQGATDFAKLNSSSGLEVSRSFPNAGIYILRDGDRYLCFNASDAGLNGRGSHGHNDALSIEISALGQPFIIDPGTYVYTADLAKRHAFRSTAYHSTARVDGAEQNTTELNAPFVIGNEARPRVLSWETSATSDKVVAEHYGYTRLASPVVHRRSVTFDKQAGWWLIDDEFVGEGEHEVEIRFHFAAGLQVTVVDTDVLAHCEEGKLVVASTGTSTPTLENQGRSRDYGELADSIAACWRLSGRDLKLSWRIYAIANTSDMV